MNRHPLDLDPGSGSIKPGHACRHQEFCLLEVAVWLALVFLVVAVAGPMRVVAGAGGIAGTLFEMVANVFDAGGFLRPSW